MKNPIYPLILMSILIALWILGYTFVVSATVVIAIASIVVIVLLKSGIGSSKTKNDEKPNIIPDNTPSVYIDPIWSYVISGVVVVIGSLVSYVIVGHLICHWIFGNIFEIFEVEDAENYTMYLSNFMWFLTVLSGIAYIYKDTNKLSIKTGDCGVITFLDDRIAPIGGTIYYLGEGTHWAPTSIIGHINVTITKHKIEFIVDNELSADNVKMRMKGFLLYAVRNPNNYAAYKEEIESILSSLSTSASRNGIRSVSMTEGIGTISPDLSSGEILASLQTMMKAISKNRKNAADTLKNIIFSELQKISEDIQDADDNEIISSKLGISVTKKDLNILDIIPTSDELLKRMEQYVSEMFERSNEYLDLDTFSKMCMLLKGTMPNLSDQEVSEIIQRAQGKFKGAETIFRGFEGFGGKMDGPTAAIVAEILKKMGKK